MKAAQDVHLPKKIIGCGGLREFILSEMNIFEGIEDHSNFFTMQERQTLILYILNTLRVQNCDWITELVESQPLSNATLIVIYFVSYKIYFITLLDILSFITILHYIHCNTFLFSFRMYV